jgi:hypothetical protein
MISSPGRDAVVYFRCRANWHRIAASRLSQHGLLSIALHDGERIGRLDRPLQQFGGNQ